MAASKTKRMERVRGGGQYTPSAPMRDQTHGAHMSTSRFQSALTYATEAGRFDPDNRDHYLAVLFAAHSAAAESGDPDNPDYRDLARNWAAQSPKFDAAAFDRDWESWRDKPGGITAATVFAAACDAGWQYSDPDAGTLKHLRDTQWSEPYEWFWSQRKNYPRSDYLAHIRGGRVDDLSESLVIDWRGATRAAYCNETGAITAVQVIWKDDAGKFQKRFAGGSKIKGAYWSSGDVTQAEDIYICEGIKTALAVLESACEAMGIERDDPRIVVVAAGSAFNCKAVVGIIRKLAPRAAITFCADDEGPGSVGRKTGGHIGRMHPSVRVAWMVFAAGQCSKARSDADDLLREEGTAAVNACLSAARFHVPDAESGSGLSLDSCRVGPLLDSEPAIQKYILPGVLPLGIVGSLLGAGGVGKSSLILQLAAGIAAGVPPFGVLPNSPLAVAPKPRSVLYLAAEDPPDVLHRRLRQIAQALRAQHHDPAELYRALCERLYMLSGIGTDTALLKRTSRGGGLEPPRRVEDIIRLALQIENLGLLVIEPVSRLLGDADENAASDVHLVVGQLERIAEDTGATVLVAHHVSKGAARAGESSQHVARGSSALVDGCRWVAQLQPGDPARIKTGDPTDWVGFSVVKSNYTRRYSDIWLYRGVDGVLSLADPDLITADDVILQLRDLVAADAAAGQTHSRTAFARHYAGKAGSLRLGRPALEQAIDQALRAGLLRLEPTTNPLRRVLLPANQSPASDQPAAGDYPASSSPAG